MIEVRETETYAAWIKSLRDRAAVQRITARIFRLSLGNPGQHRVLTGGVWEMKIDAGPGYRVYYTQRSNVLLILLCGGDKSTQAKDIKAAQALAKGE